ncbi:MAG: nucleotidyltransferase family protein [Chloroflexota bacterium]
MDVIMMAGGRVLPDDPLYAVTGLSNKALLPIAGKPMIRYVMEALAGAPDIERFVIVGLEPHECPDVGLPLFFAPARQGLFENVVAGFEKLHEINPTARLAILSTADIPLLTSDMVDWLLRTCAETDHDVYYTVVERAVMEKRFPGSGRTFVPLRDGAYCGADIFMTRTDLVHSNQALFDKLMEARKSFRKQVRLVGPGLLIRFVLRRLTVADAERRVGRALNVRGRVIVTPYAEMGMDVDKPHQLERIRAELENR